MNLLDILRSAGNVMTGHQANHGTPPQGLAAPLQHAVMPQMLQHAAYKSLLDQLGNPTGVYPGAPHPLQMAPVQNQNGQPNLGGYGGPLQGQQNPGYIPLQNSGQGGPGYTMNLQPAMPTTWQNTNGGRPNMVNPQVQDNGYYFSN